MATVSSETEFLKDVEAAVETLKEGGIILYPTDTVWGIGADATNPEAVAKIYRLKRRSDSKSMLVLLNSREALARWLVNVPAEALNIIDKQKRPTTIIFDSPKGLAENLLAEDGSLGIRITSDDYSMELCRRLGKPVVSTSANLSGETAPAIFKEIRKEILEGVDYVACCRRDDTDKKSPSGIIKVSDKGDITVIR